ncbi:hypothetical protein [Actinokineospora cianjurensis]|uniref:Streptogrisin C n=1 Tax=Actinokineospora cianjurensis TaxID=585224 RepID=A0A421BAQ7_9PSEU|nr:hypothetical protein [Actinokineospora cianjurensis]RLK61417.1 hypothetical protein CLV68_1957 [Actinokineospora cianjurensis]
MSRRSIRGLAVLAAAAVMATVPAAASGQPKSEDAGSATAPVADLVADRIGGLGLADYRDVFGGLRVESPTAVTVYARDTGRAQELVAAARKDLPDGVGAEVAVDVRSSPFTRAELHDARTALWKHDNDKAYFAIQVPAQADRLIVHVADPGAVASALSARPVVELAHGITTRDVEFTKGERPVNTSRVDDSAPYKGGIPLEEYWYWDYICTSSFGARNSSGAEFLMTAQHCFDSGDGVYDHADDYLGDVAFTNVYLDTAAIATDAGSGVYIDSVNQRSYNRAAYSWNGQTVCQSGYTSNKVCNIVVWADSIEWQDEDGQVRWGVAGSAGVGVATACPGDSGGPVWTITTTSATESRGITSAGGVAVGNCFQDAYWTETVSILNAHGLTLLTS